MASIRSRSGRLYIDFRYHGQRCREMTLFNDNKTNKKKLHAITQQIEAEILLGTFDYMAYFPKSDKASEMVALNNRVGACQSNLPLFNEFVEIWFEEKRIEWRPSYQKKLHIMLNSYCLPNFGDKCIDRLNKADLLSFRNSLAKVTYGKAQKTLSASRINQIMTLMRMILDEASERYNFDMPFKGIKQLKEEKPDIYPFSLEEVWRFLNNVRKDYHNYYLVRYARAAHNAGHDIKFTARILKSILEKTGIKNMDKLYQESENARIPTVMPFGKHKGTLISEVPRDYIDWYLRQEETDEYLVKAFEMI